MVGPGFERLSGAQKEYLGRVQAGRTSKQIALELSGSPATIDTRLLEAAKILGVHGRHAAAEVFAAHETIIRDSYEAQTLARTLEVRAAEEPTEAEPPAVGQQPGSRGTPLPFATERRSWNDLTTAQKILRIAIIAALIVTFVGGLAIGGVTVFEAVWHFIREHRSLFYRS